MTDDLRAYWTEHRGSRPLAVATDRDAPLVTAFFAAGWAGGFLLSGLVTGRMLRVGVGAFMAVVSGALGWLWRRYP